MKIKQFTNMRLAHEYIKKLIEEFPIEFCEFGIIHSVNSKRCQEERGNLIQLDDFILDYLRDLNSQEGIMSFLTSTNNITCMWDFKDVEIDEIKNHDNKCEVEVGEGIAIIFNKEQIKDKRHPIIAVKKRFWRVFGTRCKNILNFEIENEEYTAKISPAFYVEL